MSDEEILARGQEAAEAGCTELHIVGGGHPAKKFDWYLGMIRRLHEAFPRLHLKAWTAVEIDWFAQIAGRPVRAVLEDLIDGRPGQPARRRGGDLRPGGPRQICPRKADADTWLAVHRTAHRLGLRSNATMLYGHVETPAQRIDHLRAAPRAAGRDRRLPGVHPAGVPSGEHAACRTCARALRPARPRA